MEFVGIKGFLGLSHNITAMPALPLLMAMAELTSLLQHVTLSFLRSQSRSRGSSVSIVSDYGLDDRAIGVRYPAGAKDFSSSLCVQTGSGVHPASCTMGTGGPFHGVKARPGRDADHPPPSNTEVENEYTSSPPKRLHDV
jgi:hypothetical protein